MRMARRLWSPKTDLLHDNYSSITAEKATKEIDPSAEFKKLPRQNIAHLEQLGIITEE